MGSHGIKDRVAIVGMGCTRFAEHWDKSLDDLIIEASQDTFAAAGVTKTVPIVMGTASDVVAMGLVASLARPGGNITGQTFLVPELVSKRLEFLAQVAPSMTRAGVLLMRDSPSNANLLAVLRPAAEALKVELRPILIADASDLESAIFDEAGDKIGGLVSTDQSLFIAKAAGIAAIAQKRGLPSVGGPFFAANGGLMGYGVDFSPMMRHAAVFVDKILNGERPGDIPIEQATKFQTLVNLKTAKALGIEMPPMILARADKVIE